jgi:hypothetical protein
MYASFIQLGLPAQPHLRLEVPIVSAAVGMSVPFEAQQHGDHAPTAPVTDEPNPASTKRGFHFVFNSDCSRGTGWHYVSFITFYSFLQMYPDPSSGHTMTELYSCSKPKYLLPPWHAKGLLPEHCKVEKRVSVVM